MDKDHRLAAVELARIPANPLVAQPNVAFVSRQADAVRVQNVVGIGDLGEREVDVGQRQ